MKPRTRYGMLDDFGEVIRWNKYITQRGKSSPVIDWSNFEPAPY